MPLDTFTEELTSLETDLLNSAKGFALIDYATKLSKFQSFVDQETTGDSLTPNFAEDVYFTVSRVSVLANGLLRLEEEGDVEFDSLQQNMEAIFASLSLSDKQNITETTTKHQFQDLSTIQNAVSQDSSHCSIINATSSTQLVGALEWLVQNVANPYPPRSVRSRLADENRVPPKIVSDWFSSMRKRIGWTVLVKKHFAGNRPLAIDCAQRILVAPDPLRPASESQMEAVSAIRARVQSLYDERIAESELAKVAITHVGRSPEDMTRGDRDGGVAKKRRSSVDPYKASAEEISAHSITTNTKRTGSRKRSKNDDERWKQAKRRRGDVDSLTDNELGEMSDVLRNKRCRSMSSTSASVYSSASSESLETSGPHTPIDSPRMHSVVDSWLSGLSSDISFSGIEEEEALPQSITSSKKRRLSESEQLWATAQEAKRPRSHVENTNSLIFVSESREGPHIGHPISVNEELFQTLSETDMFSIPPPAVISEGIFQTDSQRDIFNFSTSCESEDSPPFDFASLTSMNILGFSMPSLPEHYSTITVGPEQLTSFEQNLGLGSCETQNHITDDTHPPSLLHHSELSSATSTTTLDNDREAKEHRLQALLAEVDLLKRELIPASA